MVKQRKCEESEDGKHSFVPDLEYDITGKTINCEFCGEAQPKTKRLNRDEIKDIVREVIQEELKVFFGR